MTSKLVVNTIESDTGISSVSFASSISMSSTSKFFFGAAGIDIGADTNINRPASGVLGFNINSSEKVRIKSDGKIGINTVSPTYGMHLHGTTASSNAYYYAEQSTAGASAGFRLKTTGSHFSIYGATSGSALGIYDYNASAERVTITSGGNILVGTATDSNNKVTLYGSNASVVMQNAATGNGPSNGFYIGNGNGTLSYVWNYENDEIRFATNNAERLRITNNGQLNTYTTGTITADFNTTNGAGSYLQFDTGASGANIGYIGAGSQLVTGSSTNDLGFRSANHMVFSTGGSVERFRINSNGQIYCTTSTTIALDLNTTSSSGAYIQLDTGVSGANIGYIGAGSQLVTGSATNDLGFRSVENLVFSTGGSTERLRIVSNGHVAIGDDIANDTGMFKVIAADGQSDDQYVGQFKNLEATTNRNWGLLIQAGSSSTDESLRVRNYANNKDHLKIRGDGLITSESQCVFEVKLNGDQAFTSGSRFRINFNYVANQQGTSFDTGNNRFTAPVAGYYQFNVGVYSYYSHFMELDGRCNGASTGAKTYRPTTRASSGNDTNPGASIMASWVVKLAQGDYYEIYCLINSGSGVKNVYSDLNRTPTWWSGYLIC